MSTLVYWVTRDPVVTEEAGTRSGTHSGIDLKAERGDEVLAPFDGVIVYAGGDGATGRLWLGDRWLYPNGEGRTVDIRRADGLISRVGHLDSYGKFRTGDPVKAGDIIGYAGDSGYSTGVHVHWELRWDRAWSGGKWINPRKFNPQPLRSAQRPSPFGTENDMIVYYAHAYGKGKPGWLVLGYTPKALVLSTQGSADSWAKKLNLPIEKTNYTGFRRYLRAAGGSTAQLALVSKG